MQPPQSVQDTEGRGARPPGRPLTAFPSTFRSFRVEQRATGPTRLLDRLRQAARTRHLSRRTEDARPQPLVLTQDEVRRILDRIDGEHRLFFALLYGSGMRLLECLRLRVKDVDLGYEQITVRDGKGFKDRLTVLPSSLRTPIEAHLASVRTHFAERLRVGLAEVYLPDALSRKWPRAAAEWPWQYVFPAAVPSRDPATGRERYHHLQVRTVQRVFARAVRAAAIDKPATCHVLRHSFATHLLLAG